QMSDEQKEMAADFVRDDIMRNRLKIEMAAYIHSKKSFQEQRLTNDFLSTVEGILDYSAVKKQSKISDTQLNLV
ncbi:hypothetical protein V0R37_22320, partial [Pollutimonas sp. H1-120]|uniref:hypothetical protein n=1 Tax=Pollutimonas sp. H1-120 TaxID=3148824 RepID=UPI003B52B776